MQKFKTARFVKNPINGVENGALLVNGLLFDVEELWCSSTGRIGYDHFMSLSPSEMAEIALELYYADIE